MNRWLIIALLFCSAALCPTSSSFAQEKKGRYKPRNPLPVAGEKEDESRVVLAFDPGSHTRPISALGFNKDQSKLITVGWDYTIQIWSAKTGERLDIIRLPAYGRDNGFDTNRWNQAAISADGTIVAIGGGPKLLYGDEGVPTRLLIVDVVNRRIRKLNFPVDAKSPVTCLSLSTSGDRLAVGFGGTDKSVFVLDDVSEHLKSAAGDAPPAARPVVQGLRTDPEILSLSPTANKLLLGEVQRITVWDVAGKTPTAWKKIGEARDAARNDTLEWAPDESHFARSWLQGNGGENRGVELRLADGKVKTNWSFEELKPGFGNQARCFSFRYLAADRLFICGHGGIGGGEGFGTLGVVLDPQTGKTVRRFSEVSSSMYRPTGTAAATGSLAATTTDKGLGVVIYSLVDGNVVARCGSRTPTPTIVGWSRDSQSPAIAWSDDGNLLPLRSRLNDLKYSFDLTQMEPVSKVDPRRFELRRLSHGDWKLTFTPRAGNFLDVRLLQGETQVAQLLGGTSLTLIPNGQERPLFARSNFDNANATGSVAYLHDGTGKQLAELLPVATYIRDMVASPDGRYLLVSTGTHRLSIYRTDGSNFPFLNFVQTNGEWVAWTPEGYFAASPGGEKLIGWAESKGSSDFPAFHAADKFAKHFRRPDVLKLAIEKGSLSEALEALNTETRGVEEILPPSCKLELLQQMGGRVQVRAVAMSGAKDQPVVALRILLDGRPLSGVQKQITPGARVETTWDLEIPAGTHELKLLARSTESSGISNPVLLKGPKALNQKPVLHRLCVGVNQYKLPALNLSSAVKDANDVFASLERNCVGEQNRFGRANGVVLTNSQATAPAVLKAIADIRRVAKSGDLVVFLFAGHGIQQQEVVKLADGSLQQRSEYYLMTHEADPSVSLKGKSLSGADLRQTLGAIECPVLLVMDSCHSASGVKAFRPAIDDLTRGLTDDATGVTVLAAAMSHEVASATAENGYFTAAFLKALEVGEGVPYDTHDHVLYTHHLYSVVFSEVRNATKGKQNPFLNMPWTVPPLALREVSLRLP